MKEAINPTERAVMETVQEKMRKQLNKRVPDIDYIDHRRLTYLLIEDRIAAYKDAGIERTLSEVLAEFGVKSTHTYYDWYEKWHRLYARDKKYSERACVFRTFVRKDLCNFASDFQITAGASHNFNLIAHIWSILQ